MNPYTVLSPFRDADGIHNPGEIVSLSDKDAAELIEIGSVATPAATVADRQSSIIDAIGKLDKENIDLWLKDGKPDTNAIADITGWPVTSLERNTAWATMTAIPAA